MESLEVKKYYQWASGQRTGRVEVYLAESDTDVYFESGRFVSKELLNSQLMEIDESTYNAKATQQDLPPPPPPVPQTIEEWEAALGTEPIFTETTSQRIQTEPQKEKSPIRIILEKQKKMSKLNLNFILENLDFPNPKVLEFLTMMFDEDEIVEEMTEFVFSQMTQEEIHECIKNSIKSHILSIDSNSGE